MIPTMILFGVVLARWWVPALVLAAVFWPALLVANDVMGIEAGLVAAAGLGVANAALGVLVHQGILWIVRRVGNQESSP